MIEFIEINKSKIQKNTQKVFDIEVETDHSFVVGDGLVVHNCITRKQTGVGRPQFSAVVECATIAHQISGKKDGRGCGMICSDGGIKIPGDIAKAFGGGADFVMIGSLYAGTSEAEGDIISKCYSTNERILHTGPGGASHETIYEDKKFKKFYGMSYTLAQEKFGN